jgi:hypothetical protein
MTMIRKKNGADGAADFGRVVAEVDRLTIAATMHFATRAT